MNKTFDEILQEMLKAKNANTVLSDLDTISKVSIWMQFFYVVAWVVFNFQEACKLHLQEVKELIANQKVFNLRRYSSEALRFQYGFELQDESDLFKPTYNDNGNEIIATDEQITASKIIKYAKCNRVIDNGRAKIVMKIAPEYLDGIFDSDVMSAFSKYMEEISPAGDHLTIINYLPDMMKFAMIVEYDPKILLANGMNILTAKFPVTDAIEKFLKNLPFDGKFSIQKLEAAILAVEGVEDLDITLLQTKWIDPGQNGYGFYQPVNMSVIPASGRFKVEDFTGIQFKA